VQRRGAKNVYAMSRLCVPNTLQVDGVREGIWNRRRSLEDAVGDFQGVEQSRTAVVWGRRCSVGTDAGCSSPIGGLRSGWHSWKNPGSSRSGQSAQQAGRIGCVGFTLELEWTV
jgi:hypothetical protein